MSEFYLVISGTRTFDDYGFFKEKCDHCLANHKNDEIHIIEGEATGADTLAKKYAEERGYILHPFPADWDKYGKAAGPKRNKKMHEFAAEHYPRGCICFWDGASPGTNNSMQLAQQFHTPLKVYIPEK